MCVYCGGVYGENKKMAKPYKEMYYTANESLLLVSSYMYIAEPGNKTYLELKKYFSDARDNRMKWQINEMLRNKNQKYYLILLCGFLKNVIKKIH